jgi:DMSO/TMAO reductase YedYZ heme-binding membrane subunit
MFKEWPIFLAGLAGLAALYLGLHTHIGGGEDHWTYAARYTARVGFPFFIIAYSASSLARLWPNPTTKALLRDRKYWGLAFATTHTFHLYALIQVLQANPRPLPVLLGGGFIYLVIYAMAATSFPWAYKALGKWWKRLHTLGIHLIWAVFVVAYGGKAFMRADQRIAGAILLVVALAALGLRIAAWRKAQAKRAA